MRTFRDMCHIHIHLLLTGLLNYWQQMWPEPQTICRTSSSQTIVYFPASVNLNPAESWVLFSTSTTAFASLKKYRTGGSKPTNPPKGIWCGPQYCQGLIQTCFHSTGAWHQLGNSGLILTSVALHPFLIWVENTTTGIQSHVSAQCQLEELLGAQLILTERE